MSKDTSQSKITVKLTDGNPKITVGFGDAASEKTPKEDPKSLARPAEYLKTGPRKSVSELLKEELARLDRKIATQKSQEKPTESKAKAARHHAHPAQSPHEATTPSASPVKRTRSQSAPHQPRTPDPSSEFERKFAQLNETVEIKMKELERKERAKSLQQRKRGDSSSRY